MKKSLILYHVFSTHKTTTINDKDEKKMTFGNNTAVSERQYRSRKNQAFPKKHKSKVNKNLSNRVYSRNANTKIF